MTTPITPLQQSQEVKEEVKQQLAIGLDVGGTHMLGIVATKDGTILHRVHESLTATERGNTKGIIEKMVQIIIRCMSLYHEETNNNNNNNNTNTNYEWMGIGLGIPGNVDPIKGTTRYLPNFGWLEEVPLAEYILQGLVSSLQQQQENQDDSSSTKSLQEKEFLHKLQNDHQQEHQQVIVMRNDGRCAALAERHYGIGKNLQKEDRNVFAMLTLGTGIGGAVCIDINNGNNGNGDAIKGILLDGCTFDAGDFGHHVICSGIDAMDCVCGKRGCFETHASAAGLVRHYRREYLKRNTTSTDTTTSINNHHQVSLDDAKSIVELMRSGDDIAKAAWKSFQDDLTTGLANLITFYNPNVICLGGGIAQANDLYIIASDDNNDDNANNNKTLMDVVDAKTLPATRGKCKIYPSSLGGDMVALGAAQLVFSSSQNLL